MRRAFAVDSLELHASSARDAGIYLERVASLVACLTRQSGDAGSFIFILHPTAAQPPSSLLGHSDADLRDKTNFICRLMDGLAICDALDRVGRDYSFTSEDEATGLAARFERRSAMREVDAGGFAVVVAGTESGLLGSEAWLLGIVEELDPLGLAWAGPDGLVAKSPKVPDVERRPASSDHDVHTVQRSPLRREDQRDPQAPRDR